MGLREYNRRVMMHLVRTAREANPVWEVLAVADSRGLTVLDDLDAADPADYGAELMLAALETDVPRNGPPKFNKTRCRRLSDEIFEFKEHGVRVLWFYDAGEPTTRRRIICSHMCAKLKKRALKGEIEVAERVRKQYIQAKRQDALRLIDRRSGNVESS